MKEVKTGPSLLFSSSWPVDQSLYLEEISQELHSIFTDFWKDNISGLYLLVTVVFRLSPFHIISSLWLYGSQQTVENS